jgi:hypothetical protein
MISSHRVAICLTLLAALSFGGCDSAKQPAALPAAPAPAALAPLPAQAAAPAGLPLWSGDLPAMLEKRVVRMLVVYSKTFYFIDPGASAASATTSGGKLEKTLNAGNQVTRDAGHRQGQERRDPGHTQRRTEHSRRREVPALPRESIFR